MWPERVSGYFSETTDWKIGIFAITTWARETAYAILRQADGSYLDPIKEAQKLFSNTLSLSQNEQEKLEWLLIYLQIDRDLLWLDHQLLLADYNAPKSKVNPYGKTLWFIPHIYGYKEHLRKNNGTILWEPLPQNSFSLWKTSWRALTEYYDEFRKFAETDFEIWNWLKNTVRTGWTQPWRNISPEMWYENVAEHTLDGINLMIEYKDAIMAELNINWREFAELLDLFAIHDFPEHLPSLGDIATSDTSISAEEKERRTIEAAKTTFIEKLKSSQLFERWNSAEERRTKTGCLIKEIDKIQAVRQALKYDMQWWCAFVEFYSWVVNKGYTTFHVTKEIMVRLWQEYLNFLQKEWETIKIQNFEPVFKQVLSIHITGNPHF
jgi:5'-deoxynucleotidase YfbR-like HD superfamily hydrolase